ncbi:MAG: dihydroorotate dehydrogenase electron transfer subunit [Planctomycetota bacterium]
MEGNHAQQKGPFEATVLFNKPLRKSFHRLGLQFTGAGAEAFAKTRPGQFAQFDISTVALPSQDAIPEELKDAASKQILLRRPFSFARVVNEKAGTVVEVVYCVLGPATLRLTTLAKGQSLNLIGPLGNGFSIPQGKKKAILVAGGMGSPPLEHLAQTLTAESPKLDVIAFAGAKTKEDMPFEKPLDKISQELGFWLGEFARYSIGSFIATDDGSAGFKGTVTNCLLEWFKQNNIDPAEIILYACGPKAMLASIAKLAAEKKIDCQVSMEEMMACGIGLCQSCAVKCVASAGSGIPAGGKTAAGEEVYKLCCKDGPVFDSKDIVF